MSNSKLIIYEQRLDSDLGWALREGSRHFEYGSAVFETLRRLTAKLDELGIPYAVVGGMALFTHGFRRFTEDVDILVTKEGLSAIQAALIGRGFRPLFQGSKNLRDTNSGVRIEFIITGEYPGSGKPQSVSFPDPAKVSIEVEGYKVLNLEKLIELKIASGMTGGIARMRDLSDVVDLIKTLRIPHNIKDHLDATVEEKFEELWQGAQAAMTEEPEEE
jgi:hypothetical protein